MEGNFPVRLHYMLSELEKDGDDDIVSWQPHGRCFYVHKRKEFVGKLLPLWFSQSHFTSFQRQLNLYGFRRINSGLDKNCYYHKYFLRGHPDLSQKITRVKGKGQGSNTTDLVDSTSNFYNMPFLPASSEEANKSSEVHVQHEDQKPAFSSWHDKAGSQEQELRHQELSLPPPVFFYGHSRQRHMITSTKQENLVSGPALEIQDSSIAFAINRKRIQDHLHEILLSNTLSISALDPYPSVPSSTTGSVLGNRNICFVEHQHQLKMHQNRLFSLSSFRVPDNPENVSIQYGHSTF